MRLFIYLRAWQFLCACTAAPRPVEPAQLLFVLQRSCLPLSVANIASEVPRDKGGGVISLRLWVLHRGLQFRAWRPLLSDLLSLLGPLG